MARSFPPTKPTSTTSEVAFGCVNAGLPRAEVLERVEGAFRRMGIQHLRDRSVFGLSSGEMQMVAIASCYAMGPSVYVFDEPSASLDMEAVKTLRRAMSELKHEVWLRAGNAGWTGSGDTKFRTGPSDARGSSPTVPHGLSGCPSRSKPSHPRTDRIDSARPC